MITCKEIAELLMAYCEGELPKEYCDLICQHIRLCGPCDNYVTSYQLTIRLTRALPMAAVPQGLLDKVLRRHERAGRASRVALNLLVHPLLRRPDPDRTSRRWCAMSTRRRSGSRSGFWLALSFPAQWPSRAGRK